MKRQRFHPGLTGMYRRFGSKATVIADSIYSSLQSPLAARAHELLCNKQLVDLVSLSVDPSTYEDVETFRRDYLAAELMSKFDSFELGIDRVQVALEKFFASEDQCRSTNLRLSQSYEPGICTPYSPESFLWTAREKIASVLGDLCWSECSTYFAFGPGASTSVTRERGDAYFKYGVCRPHTTKANALLSLAAVKAVPRWFSFLLGSRDVSTFLNLPAMQQAEELFEFVPGNKVTTVPKSAKTDRTIAVEPDLNMYIQKGLGGVIRRRLKRVGIDLDDQTNNQRLAKLASLTGELATIDLSSASDCISLRLVELLLPPDWTEAIKQARSPRGTMPDGSLITYQKVSSMGNGFTFELESLIFWALCSSVISHLRPASRRLAVYGDDLILSSEICHTVLWLLKYSGFTPNTKKTFSTGPFRESCGKHYFRGIDVSPFYIKKDVKSPDRLISVANRIRTWSVTAFGLDALLMPSYHRVVSLLPKALQRPSIPCRFGDIALWGDFDECCPQKATRGWEGWIGVGFQQKSVDCLPDDDPLLVRNLHILERTCGQKRDGSEVDLSVVNLKPREIKWQVVRPVAVQWENFGAWLAPDLQRA